MIKLFKFPLLIFLFGMLITLFGAWTKMLHHSIADMLLTAGMLLQGIGLIYAIFILVKTKY